MKSWNPTYQLRSEPLVTLPRNVKGGLIVAGHVFITPRVNFSFFKFIIFSLANHDEHEKRLLAGGMLENKINFTSNALYLFTKRNEDVNKNTPGI